MQGPPHRPQVPAQGLRLSHLQSEVLLPRVLTRCPPPATLGHTRGSLSLHSWPSWTKGEGGGPLSSEQPGCCPQEGSLYVAPSQPCAHTAPGQLRSRCAELTALPTRATLAPPLSLPVPSPPAWNICPFRHLPHDFPWGQKRSQQGQGSFDAPCTGLCQRGDSGGGGWSPGNQLQD